MAVSHPKATHISRLTEFANFHDFLSSSLVVAEFLMISTALANVIFPSLYYPKYLIPGTLMVFAYLHCLGSRLSVQGPVLMRMQV